MAKDESELVPMNKEPGYGGTDADEESKKPDIDISDFKPAAPTWVLDCAQINPCVTVRRAADGVEYGLLYAVASTSAPAAA